MFVGCGRGVRQLGSARAVVVAGSGEDDRGVGMEETVGRRNRWTSQLGGFRKGKR